MKPAITPADPRLVAYVLGELSGSEMANKYAMPYALAERSTGRLSSTNRGRAGSYGTWPWRRSPSCFAP